MHSDPFDLADEVALVTGAGVGIGRAIAHRLSERGALVAVSDLNADAAASVASEIADKGYSAVPFALDIGDATAVDRVADELAFTTARHVSILVNNAGIWSRHTGDSNLFAESDGEAGDAILDINIRGTIRVTRRFLPEMIAGGRGRIINIASIAGVTGLRGMVEYSASKGAIIAFSKALAIEVAPAGVTVNSVSPGSIATGLSNPRAAIPTPGTPDDIAHLVSYLASSAARFITGQNLVVDGGRTLSTWWPESPQP